MSGWDLSWLFFSFLRSVRSGWLLSSVSGWLLGSSRLSDLLGGLVCNLLRLLDVFLRLGLSGGLLFLLLLLLHNLLIFGSWWLLGGLGWLWLLLRFLLGHVLGLGRNRWFSISHRLGTFDWLGLSSGDSFLRFTFFFFSSLFGSFFFWSFLLRGFLLWRLFLRRLNLGGSLFDLCGLFSRLVVRFLLCFWGFGLRSWLLGSIGNGSWTLALLSRL